MKIKKWQTVLVVAACAAFASGAMATPTSAAPDGKDPTPSASAARRSERKAIRARAAAQVSEQAEAEAAGPVQAAAEGDALVINDPASSQPKGDLRQVLVGSGGGPALRFTMQVEQYSDPYLDSAWVLGSTSALWFLDTSGDDEYELIIDLYNDGETLVAEVYDEAGFAYVCAAGALTSAATKTYTAVVTLPGCLGDVKQPAVLGMFVLDDPVLGEGVDIAPNDGHLVRFNRPPPGQPSGGYTIVSRSAGFQRYGAVPQEASVSGTLDDFPGDRPVVATAGARPFFPMLWGVTDDGAVMTKDWADWHGDMYDFDVALSAPIVGMSVLPDGSGYWLVARDGGVFGFGSARYLGSMGGRYLAQPIVGMAATPTGEGYWLVASDGGIFAFGDAAFHGSMGGQYLFRPIVGMAAGHQGQGYWLVASDGGIFSYGLPFHGSTGGTVLQQPIVGMALSRSGGGYRFIARDGGLFSYGDAEFHGSGAAPGRNDVIGLATA